MNGLSQVIRSHQIAQKGYNYEFPDKSVLTVWSAPNYCYRYRVGSPSQLWKPRLDHAD